MDNFKHSVVHGVLAVVAMVIPVILLGGYSWESLTVGGVLTAVLASVKMYLATNTTA